MKHFDFGNAYYEMVKHLKEEIAFQLDVNPKHIEIAYIEGDGTELWDDENNISTVRKVSWRTVYWDDKHKKEYGEFKDCAWVTYDSGEGEGSDEVHVDDYDNFMAYCEQN